MIVISGGFDPLHVGHLNMFKEASKLGPVTVILNRDDYLIHKKGKVFMPWDERRQILKALRYVKHVIPPLDKDHTVKESLRVLKPKVFVNGGDVTPKITPEEEVCRELGIKLMYNVGKKVTDTHSSSQILEKYHKNSQK